MVSIRTTDTHVYFWGSEFSNFYQLPPADRRDVPLFRQSLWKGGPPVGFNSTEQYFMACKAMLFGNVEGFVSRGVYNPSLLERILAEIVPSKQKALGREVFPFDDERWRRNCLAFMFRGNWAKWTQNHDLMLTILNTQSHILVEGAPNDRIWGVGLHWDDPRIEDKNNWLGTNWLGEILMLVRHLIVENYESGLQNVDPWKVEFPWAA